MSLWILFLHHVLLESPLVIIILQIQGKFYIRIDPVGEGARWRRTFGQEIYSPLLLAFAEQVKGKPLS